jgi:hypothetical protein
MADQEGQQVELANRQRHRPAGDSHLAGGRIDGHVPGAQRHGALAVAGPGPAQHAAHPGDELAGAERLDDVVVGAQLQADDPVRLVALGGQHDDRGRVLGADLAAHLQAIHTRQHQIQDDQVRDVGAEGRQRGRAVLGRLDAITLTFQVVLHDLADGRFVIDDQDPFPGHAPSLPASTLPHPQWSRQVRPDTVTSS